MQTHTTEWVSMTYRLTPTEAMDFVLTVTIRSNHLMNRYDIRTVGSEISGSKMPTPMANPKPSDPISMSLI